MNVQIRNPRFGVLNAPRRPLGEVCKPDKIIVDPKSAEARSLPYLSLEHIQGESGRILPRAEAKLEDEGRGVTFRFSEAHVLYGKLRPYLNKVALPTHAGRCTTEAIPLLPTRAITREYLAWLLRRPATVAWVMLERTGSRMPRADMDHLLQLPVPVPNIETQEALIAALTAQLAAIEPARLALMERAEAASALPTAILRRAFHGITPLAVEAKDSPCAPAGWRWVRLADVAELKSGHTPSRRRPEWWDGEILWLALTDIRALDGKVAEDTAERINQDGIANSSARILPKGTVAMSRTASIGFVTIFGRPMATSQDFMNWVCGPELEPRFLLYLLLGAREFIHRMASGAIHKTIYMPQAKAIRICIPDVEVQRRLASEIEDQIAATSHLTAAISEEAKTMDDLAAALMRDIFGEG